MEATELIELFDFCWYQMEIFKKPINLHQSSGFDDDPDQQIEGETLKPALYRVPTIITRSMSDQLLPETIFGSGFSPSPDSVLVTPKLKPILSGKEIAEDEDDEAELLIPIVESPKRKGRSRRRGKKNLSKSLSELEFEELKGFMDLGFVFSEEDKDSSLVSIIPGLQRLGKKDGGDESSDGGGSGGGDKATVSRPYLSEAWESWESERRKKKDPLMNWRIPAINNEIDMKDSLKMWAQTVASTVK